MAVLALVITQPGLVLSFKELLVHVCEASEVIGRKDLPDGPPDTLSRIHFYIVYMQMQFSSPMLYCVNIEYAIHFANKFR